MYSVQSMHGMKIYRYNVESVDKPRLVDFIWILDLFISDVQADR